MTPDEQIESSPDSKPGILYTTRTYPCGCKAEGPGDVPPYCDTHNPPPPREQLEAHVAMERAAQAAEPERYGGTGAGSSP